MATPLRPAASNTVELATDVLGSVETLADTLVGRIQAAERQYLDSPLLTKEQLRDVCVDNLSAILGYLAGTEPLRVEAARQAGRLKAEQGLPIAAMLHAYRLGGRLIWEELMARSAGVAERELLQLPAELWEVIDRYSNAAAQSYRETDTLLAYADAEARARLIRTLFDDHSENPGRVLEALRALALPDAATFAVVSAEVGDARTAVSSSATARPGRPAPRTAPAAAARRSWSRPAPHRPTRPGSARSAPRDDRRRRPQRDVRVRAWQNWACDSLRSRTVLVDRSFTRSRTHITGNTRNIRHTRPACHLDDSTDRLTTRHWG